MIYPIEIKYYLGHSIAVPKYAEIICEFLYGLDWKTPKKKGIDYSIVMIGGRPLRSVMKDGNGSIVD